MTGFETKSEMQQWLLNCPRFQTPRESLEAARARAKLKRPDWYRLAIVSVILSQLRVEITMPVRHTQENCRQVDALNTCIWPVEFPDQIRAAGRHWEVLRHCGRYGFITRLVVRGYPPEKSHPFIDLGSIEFCILHQPPKVFLESENPEAIDPVEITGPELLESPVLRSYALPLTPGRLCRIVSFMRECRIKTIGHTRVSGLFNRGVIHRVGGAFTEPEKGGVRQAACISA